MAITVQKLRRIEIWSAWAAAGGVRQAVVCDASALPVVSNLTGSDQLTFTLPILSSAAQFVIPGAVIRVEEADAVFDEWKIVEGPNDDDGTGQRTVQAAPIGQTDFVDCDFIRRIDSDGTVVMDFESVGLTPTQHLNTWVLPALARGGLTWVSLGVITPTKLLNLTFSWDSPLAVLKRIAEQTETELDIRRIVGGYAIDLVTQIGSAAPIADVRFDRNLRPGTQRVRSSIDQATRVFPQGASEDEGHATMARATWQVTVIAGSVLTLADPAGGAGPIQFDGQLAGLNGTTQAYLRKTNGTLTQVTASSATNQTVTVASATGITVGDLIQFRADSAGNDMVWLDSPPDRQLYGLHAKPLPVGDVPSTNNLLKNSAMRSWPGSASAPPPNWASVGAGTVARQAVAPYTRVGGFSLHRVGVADGDGVISDAVPIFPTALNPYVSGYAGLWVVSGQVRVELVFTTAGGPIVEPILPDVASNSVLGQWEDLGLSGIDANAIGATAVALRVVQHGATVADFYLDYGQVTQSPSQLPFAEASGGTRLWQAGNELLRTHGAPLVSYNVPLADLAALDPVTWNEDCKLTLGGKVRISDPKLSVVVLTRLIELRRDYARPGDTQIILSNKHDDLTEVLLDSGAPPRANPNVNGGPGLKFAEAVARITATTATQVTVTVTANPASPAQQVQLVGVTGGATLASGTAPGTWVTPNGTNNVWVFNRGAFGGGVGQAQFRAGNVTGFQNDDDLVSIEEQGRDTVALTSRARVTATTPTTLTVRVAVADPYPQGAASATIGYSELGTGGATSPATGQTVTPAATLTEAAGTFVDFTVTRPAFGAGAGRITFTVTAANRTSDGDAVDVPEVDRDTVSLLSRARVTATTPTTLTVRVAVADPFPQGAASATIAWQDLGSGGVSPASGQTVTPASTLTEAAGTFVDFTVTRPAFGSGAGRVTFTSSAANRQSAIDAVDVPPIDRDTQSITARVTGISETSTQLVVRVEAITPNASVTATVNYDSGGLTVSPATGGTFAATSSFGTTGHIDYTIDRDVIGGSQRRVAFTITASGYIDGTDGIDVPPRTTRFIRFKGHHGANTAVANITYTSLPIDTTHYDADGLHSGSDAFFTIPAGGDAGVWTIIGRVVWDTNATGVRELQLLKNAGAILDADSRAAVSTGTEMGVSVTEAFAVGDTIALYAWQNSGASRNVTYKELSCFFIRD